ncbi:MAG: Nif3-like dinuclear metal center hexameric protein, partial [Bacteroidota bacterium]
MLRYMTVRDVQKIIEAWAPKEIAWERDNVGLQVGSPEPEVKRILVCLDATEGTIREAAAKRANLIISHHPLLFRPLRTVDLRDTEARCIEKLLSAGITLCSVHTNLDFTRAGTSFALAEKLGLAGVDFLHKDYRLSRKIVTFVPADHADRVAEAMGMAGAGRIGNYELCSFRSQGIGTFRGNESSTPTVGEKGKREHVEEIRLEMIAEKPKLNDILRAMIDAHPYEEVAYDVYPLENISQEYGMGIIGDLPRRLSESQFVAHVKRMLGSKALRYARGRRAHIHRVAACGGSGADLTAEAIRQGADAFVTADVKYHGFHEAAG